MPQADVEAEFKIDDWESDNADQLVLEEPGSARLGLVQVRAENNLRDPQVCLV